MSDFRLLALSEGRGEVSSGRFEVAAVKQNCWCGVDAAADTTHCRRSDTTEALQRKEKERETNCLTFIDSFGGDTDQCAPPLVTSA